MIEELMKEEYGFSLNGDSREMYADIVNSKFVAWVVLDISDESRPIELYRGSDLSEALRRMCDES